MLRALNLVKSFHDPAGGVVHAVAGLSLAVEPGVIYGLLGPNGAGKTTTLRILATLTRPDAGEVHIGDIDALRHPVEARARMAYVPAEGGLPARLSALEAVTLFNVPALFSPSIATPLTIDASPISVTTRRPSGCCSESNPSPLSVSPRFHKGLP